MELLNQPITGQLGNRLIELLDSSDYHTLNIVVAFAKNSGVLRIKDAFERFRDQGGIINVYVGIDMGVTSYDALTSLLLHSDSLNIVHSDGKIQTFHPKIYQFLGKEKGLMVVGSHNLTGGGLWTNFESSVLIPLDEMGNNTLVKGLENYIGKLNSLKNLCMSIGVQDDIDKLLQNNYISKEKPEEKENRLKAATQNESSERLFGKGVSANIPNIAKKKKKGVVSTNPTEPISSIPIAEGQAFWFATGGMTGGSTNIIDLSKRSLVKRGDPTNTSFDLGEYFAPGEKRYMRGIVAFFGIEPKDTNYILNITLKLEGINYMDNIIFHPNGEKSNKSWRLQMGGVSSSDESLIDAFKAKGGKDYLKHKIVKFTKIQDNYYSMSVHPESELEEFKADSRILAINGIASNSRQIGII